MEERRGPNGYAPGVGVAQEVRQKQGRDRYWRRSTVLVRMVSYEEQRGSHPADWFLLREQNDKLRPAMHRLSLIAMKSARH
jgi:hypothetical protein